MNINLLVVLVLFTLNSFANSNLNGNWQTGCKSGLKKEQVIKLPFVDLIEQFYKDKDCQNLSFKFQTSGSLAFGENPTWIDFTYQQIQLTIYVQTVIDDLNQRSVCGFNNWRLGEPQFIIGLQCALFNINRPTQIPRFGEMKYGIFSLIEDKLYYGLMTKELDGSSPLKRPETFDNTTIYFKHLEIF